MIEDIDLISIQEARIAAKEANQAQKVYVEFSQSQVDRIIEAVAKAAYENAERLAILAVKETQMGIVEHKKLKNVLASQGLYETIKHKKTVGIIKEDFQSKKIEIADPFGVVLAISPVTNPTATAIFKSLLALKTRNGVVFSPHPSAVNCTIEALKICHDAAVKAGAPSGIIRWVEHPTIKASEELMRDRNVHLILATGGSGLVKAAYSSGKPAYGVGPGNVPAYIDKTANIQKSVKQIVDSKSFDNSTICATEQAIVVHAEVKELVIRELKQQGVYFLNNEEKQKVASVLSPIPRTLNPKIVGKSAKYIAKLAKIFVPDDTRVLLAEEHLFGKEYPFSMEKLSPVLGLYTVADVSEAVNTCRNLLDVGGRGHSLAIHANDEQLVKAFSLKMPVYRIVVNTMSALGAPGGTTSLVPSFTLGCGSYGGNITSDNISVEHLLNIKRIAYGIKEIDIPKPASPFNHYEEDLTVLEKKFDTKMVENIVTEILQRLKV